MKRSYLFAGIIIWAIIIVVTIYAAQIQTCVPGKEAKKHEAPSSTARQALDSRAGKNIVPYDDVLIPVCPHYKGDKI